MMLETESLCVLAHSAHTVHVTVAMREVRPSFCARCSLLTDPRDMTFPHSTGPLTIIYAAALYYGFLRAVQVVQRAKISPSPGSRPHRHH